MTSKIIELQDLNSYLDATCQVVHGDAIDFMAEIPEGVVDLILTSPPYQDKEVPWPYYEWLEDFISASMNVSPRMLMFNSSQRLVEICQRFNPRTVLIWDKKCGMTAFRYEPIFLFIRDPKEKIWGPGRIYRNCIGCVPVRNKQHINENPVKLYVELLKFFPKANMILDPFMGSWTTAVAAKELDKKWLGTDNSISCCEIGKKRLEE